MSTLSNRPIGFQSRECSGCGAALFVASVAGVVLCPACERSDAVARIGKLAAEAQALRDGTGIFAGMTVDERSEQLAALGLPAIDSKPKYPGFASMDSDRLIRIIAGDDLFTMPGESAGEVVGEALAEICRRLAPPTDEEREDIEATCCQLDAAGRENFDVC
jgi:hypothetical protein